MQIKKLTPHEFDTYAKEHPLSSYHQSSQYANVMKEKGYDCDFIGYVNEYGIIQAASLILHKKIGRLNRYGYAPKGFLVDYYNEKLLEEFTKAIKKYYYKRNFSFIKVNPEIAIGAINPENYDITYNENKRIQYVLENNGYKHLGKNMYFETKLPRFNAILPLKTFDFNKFAKQTKNKIRKANRKGLSLEKVGRDEIKILYKFIKNKKNKDIDHYINYYNSFKNNSDIDIFLVKIDYEQALIEARKTYDKEELLNEKYNEKLRLNPTTKNITNKMNSDQTLDSLKKDIILTTRGLTLNKYEYIAGAITIKYKNRVYILISGFDKKFERCNANYFLHYSLCNYYKDKYDYIDFNGITGNFNKENPYNGLNEFKLGFNPKLFEFIGEFDLIINKGSYTLLEKNNLLNKEFTKKQKNVV